MREMEAEYDLQHKLINQYHLRLLLVDNTFGITLTFDFTITLVSKITNLEAPEADQVQWEACRLFLRR